MGDNKGLAKELSGGGDIGATLVDILKVKESDVGTDVSDPSHPLHGLAKEMALNKLVAEDMPIEDATAQMLVMAQGPKAFTYLSPELTTATRISNAVASKNPQRLTGLPSKKDLVDAIVNKEVRDKQLWRTTGNGIKANQWVETYGN